MIITQYYDSNGIDLFLKFTIMAATKVKMKKMATKLCFFCALMYFLKVVNNES